ncbi:MAG TPA: protease complex subunit PrcB family protein [Tissierellia bacterium]|nr:protease complex subunit PrcB family protein [Tissierellia bacterium]
MKKHYVVIGILVVIMLGIIITTKIVNKGDAEVKFKVLESSEIPEKIKEILPKYLSEEKALTCRLNDEIYVVVTRGEKRTGGYSVEVDSIIKEERGEGEFDITVIAKYSDPDEDDIVTQGFDYPFTIVKTNLDEMPKSINLQVKYED